MAVGGCAGVAILFIEGGTYGTQSCKPTGAEVQAGLGVARLGNTPGSFLLGPFPDTTQGSGLQRISDGQRHGPKWRSHSQRDRHVGR